MLNHTHIRCIVINKQIGQKIICILVGCRCFLGFVDAFVTNCSTCFSIDKGQRSSLADVDPLTKSVDNLVNCWVDERWVKL